VTTAATIRGYLTDNEDFCVLRFFKFYIAIYLQYCLKKRKNKILKYENFIQV